MHHGIENCSGRSDDLTVAGDFHVAAGISALGIDPQSER